MSEQIYNLAYEILSKEGNEHLLDDGLRHYLDDIEQQCCHAGGIVRSRQIVALAIVTWVKLNVLHERIKDLEEGLYQ